MKYSLLLLAVIGGCTQAPVLTIPDRAGLGSYLAFTVVTSTDTTTPDDEAPPAPKPDGGSMDCPECGSPATGLVGDGTIMVPCPNPDCPARRSQEPPTITEDQWDEMINSIEPVEAEPRLSPRRVTGSRWTVAGRSSYTRDYIANHLMRTHGFDAKDYSKAELQIIHDNLHEGKDAFGRSSSSCPDGNCPLPSSSSSRSTSSCPGGNCPSPSRSRGFFFRR